MPSSDDTRALSGAQMRNALGAAKQSALLLRLRLKTSARGRWIEDALYWREIKYLGLIYGALYTPPMAYYSFVTPYLNEPYVVSAFTMFALQLIALGECVFYVPLHFTRIMLTI